MTLINVQNSSGRSAIVPARGGFGIVLNPGETGTVCPEGLRGQGKFWDLVSRGVISEKSRRRQMPVHYVNPGTHGGSNKAA